MTRYLHVIFWIALAILTVYILQRVLIRPDVSESFSIHDGLVLQDAYGVMSLLLMRVGPIAALYGAAIFSRKTWFQKIAAGAALLLALAYPFATLLAGVAFFMVGLSRGCLLFLAWLSRWPSDGNARRR